MTGAGHPSVKITVPHAMARTVDRPALRERLDALTRDHRVVVVSAPAGYGKTTALAQWAEKETRAVAWLSLDASDDDPGRLLGGLLASVRAALGPGPPSVVGMPRTPVTWHGHRGAGARLRQSHVDAFLVALEEAGQPLVLVLDDVHVLHTPGARDLLASLARYVPDGVHLVVSSRYDPPLPVQRLQAAGDLGVLRREDLALAPDHVELVVAELGLEVDAATVAELATATGGWPAAVRLTGLALRDAPDPAARIRELAVAPTPLADYLLEEVVDTLDADLAAFVLDATAVRRIDADLARALHGDTGPALLERCVRSGLFLTAFERSGAPTAYRWHELFAAQCQEMLHRSDPARFARVHRAAAEALGSSDLAAAVGHAATAHDPELATRLLLAGWADVFVAGEATVLHRLVDAVDGTERGAADVVLVDAACHVLDDDPAADTILALARSRRGRLPAGRRAAFDVAEPLVALYATREQGARDARLLDGERGLLAAADDLEPATRALAYYLVGSAEARLAYDDAAALAHLREGARVAAEAGCLAIELACLAESTLPTFGVGDLDGAGRLARDVLRRAERPGWDDTSAVAPGLLVLGMIAYARDELDEASALLRRTLELTRTRGRAVGLRAAVVLMSACLAAGDAAGLAQARAEVAGRGDALDDDPTIADLAQVVEARVLVEAGDAARGADRLRRLEGTTRAPIGRVWAADMYRRAGLRDEAWAALGGVPADRHHTELSVSLALTTALLHDAAGDARLAHEALEVALDDAEERGILRPFGERGSELVDLLGAHLTWGTRHEAFVGARLNASASHDDSRRTPAYWELTDREREILLYLRSPMTAADVAAALFVSVNTVKTHQRAIYRKLGVTGRRDAVRVAFERGLLTGV